MWSTNTLLPPSQALQRDFKNQEDSLESVNTKGTALVDGSQLFERVEAYESEYDKFNDWLGGQKAAIGSFTPPAVTVEELRAQLEQVEVSASWIQLPFLSVKSA